MIRQKNVTSRVFSKKIAPPSGGLVFSTIWTIFKLVRDINKTNVLTKFHDDWAKLVISRVFTTDTALPHGGNLHEYWASNVTSTAFTSFNLSGGIIGTNVLTKFYEYRTRHANVDDERLTHDGRRTKGDPKNSP
ncbi:hypothetical protein DPMN_183966 [Dreissena polymorpha]|uniref:Uncharacterized protein n=1 Tax=Dreissena polymorpha TaxID=45954 RepID=A0A9D4I6V7_DREPO|nr:hypothetical protein DPMN_183966 [Dreissena polymorpha]